MPSLVGTDLADLVSATLRELGRFKISQIAQQLTRYEVYTKWFKKDKLTFEDGIGIQRNLLSRLSNNAAHVGLLDEDTVNIVDVLDQLRVDWVQATTSYGIIREETLMNRGASRIVDLIKARRTAAMLDMIQELENKAWAAPTSSSDKLVPFGLPYWVVKASGTPSHQGGYPSGWTSIAGVDLADSPNFKNWTGQYVSKTKADLVKKMRTMHRKCGFIQPIDKQDFLNGKGEQYRVYVNEATISAIEDLGEAQNENLGRDIASIDGMGMAFRGHPIVYVPKLDEDTTDPVYMIDHGTFYPVGLKGAWFYESQKPAPNQHRVAQVFIDTSYNYLCVNRRCNGVLYV